MAMAVPHQYHTPDAPAGGAMPSASDQPQRLRDEAVEKDAVNWTIAMHVCLLVSTFMPLAFLGSVIIWLVRRNDSAFLDDHGREIANVLITGLIVSLSTVVLVTIPFAIAWTIVIFISGIRGALFASDQTYFRYPMIIRFL